MVRWCFASGLPKPNKKNIVIDWKVIEELVSLYKDSLLRSSLLHHITRYISSIQTSALYRQSTRVNPTPRYSATMPVPMSTQPPPSPRRSSTSDTRKQECLDASSYAALSLTKSADIANRNGKHTSRAFGFRYRGKSRLPNQVASIHTSPEIHHS